MTDIVEFPPGRAEQVIRFLAEVQPGVHREVGMGFHGVAVMANDQTLWYFDTSWGGDDGPNEEGRLRIYVNHQPEPLAPLELRDLQPDDAPLVTDDPFKIARWITAVIAGGLPPENP